MFTGIIETTGIIRDVSEEGTNRHFWIESSLTGELKIDQSLAHNGVCLTVVDIRESQYKVTAVEETLLKTCLGNWERGQMLNLERALRVGDRLDGHFVQGHVDAVIICTEMAMRDGSWLFTFSFDSAFAPLIVEKGSVCIDGVSLTAFNVGDDRFSVAIIPYTYEHTGFQLVKQGQRLNVEFDVLGKYLLRSRSLMAS